jgi:ATP-dependent Clp protease ATP-binding subunit ClpC
LEQQQMMNIENILKDQLERRFQPVHVEEPTVGTTIEILRGLRSKFEQHHTLSYHDKALEQAAILSDKYVADRYLPDKAIDVLDDVASKTRKSTFTIRFYEVCMNYKKLLKIKKNVLKSMILKQPNNYYHEMEVRTHIRIMKQSALTSEARGFSRRDVDMVTETDVSGWTEFNSKTGSESARLLKDGRYDP